MKFFKNLLVAILFLSFAGCDTLDELANDNTVLLTTKVWTFESVEGYDDFTTQLASAFLTGMTFQFRADGTYTAAILGQSGDSTWEFNTDKTIIILEPGSVDEVNWTIVTLNDTHLIVTFEDVDALDGVATWTFK